eukprot:SAG22_NODE_76_length_22248_cov_14.352070_9_plen_402_part_00
MAAFDVDAALAAARQALRQELGSRVRRVWVGVSDPSLAGERMAGNRAVPLVDSASYMEVVRPETPRPATLAFDTHATGVFEAALRTARRRAVQLAQRLRRLRALRLCRAAAAQIGWPVNLGVVVTSATLVRALQLVVGRPDVAGHAAPAVVANALLAPEATLPAAEVQARLAAALHAEAIGDRAAAEMPGPEAPGDVTARNKLAALARNGKRVKDAAQFRFGHYRFDHGTADLLADMHGGASAAAALLARQRGDGLYGGADDVRLAQLLRRPVAGPPHADEHAVEAQLRSIIPAWVWAGHDPATLPYQRLALAKMALGGGAVVAHPGFEAHARALDVGVVERIGRCVMADAMMKVVQTELKQTVAVAQERLAPELFRVHVSADDGLSDRSETDSELYDDDY